MYQLVICDDEAAQAQALQKLLEQLPQGSQLQIGVLDGAQQLFAHMDSGATVDILLMDIALADANGIAAVEKLADSHKLPAVIYISGYPTYSQDVYRTPHVWFLIKPIAAQRLAEALDAAIAVLEQERAARLHIRTAEGDTLLECSHIVMMESCGRQVEITLDDGSRHRAYASLSQLMSAPIRDGHSLLQCHKSYAVNLAFVSTLSNGEFCLRDGTRIPISQSRRKESRRRFLTHVSDSL